METQIINATEYRNVSLALLNESKTNPRRTFEETALKELAESIRTQGVLSPLLVRPLTENGFEIIAGARRYRAAQMAEVSTVPVRIVNLSDAEALEAQLVENLVRSEIHPMEEAQGFRALLDLEEPKYSIEQIGARVGKSPAFVASLCCAQHNFSYVNNNPLAFVDPTGEVDGWANGLGGGPCSQLHNRLEWDTTFSLPGGGVVNPCAPLASAIADGIYYGVSELAKDGVFNGIDASVGLSAKASQELLTDSLAWVGFGISIACSIDSGTNACGEKGWASIFVKGNAAKVIDDSLSLVGAISATTCAAGNGVGCAIALGYVIYSGLNDLFGVLWSEFGPAPFKGSLLPRPEVRGGLGTTLTGVPNHSSLANSSLGVTTPRN